MIRTLVLSALAAVGTLAASAAPASAIVNGSEAVDGGFPWTVALITSGEPANLGQFCGGTLIAPNRVLTAAHCTYEPESYDSMPASAIDVLANQTSLRATGCVGSCGDGGSTDYAVGQRIAVSEISRHSLADVPNLRYDVAILTLSQPVIMPSMMGLVPSSGQALAPAADENIGVPPTSPLAGAWGPGTDTYVFGWGRRNVTTNGGSTSQGTWTYPDVMRWVGTTSGATPSGSGRMERLSDSYCQSRYASDFYAEDMLCAGPANPATDKAPDSCNGDSGGPLLRKSMLPEYDLRPANPPDDPGIDPARQATYLRTVAANWKLVGVVSWGPSGSCGDPQQPGVYARVGAPAISSYINDASPPPSPVLTDPASGPTITGSYSAGTITCRPGSWQNATSFEYVMWRDANGDRARAGEEETLLSGSAAGSYQVTSSDVAGRSVGQQIGCLVTARGPGGYTTAQATSLVDLTIPPPGTNPGPAPTPSPTPPAQVDRLRPRLLKDFAVCTTTSCRVSVFAADTGLGASGMRAVTAKLLVRRTVRCKAPVKRGKRCFKTTSRTVTLKRKGELRSVTLRKLRRSDTNTLEVRAVDRAGNRAVLSIKLRLRSR